VKFDIYGFLENPLRESSFPKIMYFFR